MARLSASAPVPHSALRRERSVVRGFSGWALATAAVTAAVISAAPSSLATWNGADTVDAGTVDAGTLNAAIAPGTITPTTATSAALGAFTGMLPGESRGATFTIRNTGNVDLVLAAGRGAATNANLSLDLASGACPATPPAGTPISTTPVAIGTPLAPMTNASFCLRVTLDATTPANLQGAPIGGFTLDLTAGSTP